MYSSMLKFSVISVTKNNLSALLHTVQSVRAQHNAMVELIIVDGNSTDGTKAWLQTEAAADYWLSEPDIGIYDAMNKGVCLATGDYVIFLNAGDSFSSADVLERVAALHPVADILCGTTVLLNELRNVKPAPESITLKTLFCSALCHQAVFTRTSLLKAMPFDTSLKWVADRKFFLQALVFGNSSYFPMRINIVDYDVHGTSANNRLGSEQEFLKVLQELLPPRIMDDYARASWGPYYKMTPYDSFYFTLKCRRYGSVVYRLNILLLKFISIWKKSAAFVWHYPSKV